MKADLHMHSTYSDGLKTPEELFQLATERGIDIIAITDHDIVDGVQKNIALSKKYGVTYIVGIELSTIFKGKPVHILGYFKDESYQNEEMLQYYMEIRLKREERAKKFIRNLKEYFDIDITYEEVLSFSRGIIARPHIAKAITKNYPHYKHDYIFDHFIGDHSRAYVPSCELSVEEGLELLRRNNCVVVLAHPVLLKPYFHDRVLEYDYDGLEAIYYLNKPESEAMYKNLAKERNLLITAGSDYHGIPFDTRHGDLGEVYLDGDALIDFLNALKK
jgi:predicted metal-dependent phosphoesterase TrpH